MFLEIQKLFSSIGIWALHWIGILIFVLGYFMIKIGAVILGEPRLKTLVIDFRQGLDLIQSKYLRDEMFDKG